MILLMVFQENDPKMGVHNTNPEIGVIFLT